MGDVTIETGVVFVIGDHRYADPYEASVAALMPACRFLMADEFVFTQLAYALASKPEARAMMLKAIDDVDKIMDRASPAGSTDIPF